MSTQVQESQFDLSAGVLALDFTNTVHDRTDDNPSDDIESYHDLLAFARESRILRAGEAEHLSEIADRRPFEANAVLASATSLREMIFRITAAIVEKRAPDEADLNGLNSALSAALQHGCIVQANGGFRWSWQEVPDALDRVLWPIAYSALELMTGGDLDRLRMCDADDCSWLFIDTSRNKSRKWCDMKTCGNRAKVARYRERHEHEGVIHG